MRNHLLTAFLAIALSACASPPATYSGPATSSGAPDTPCASDAALSCSGATLWTLPLTGQIETVGVTASPDGEVTVFGWARTIDIGLGPEGDPNGESLFVARIGAAGSPRWLRTFAGIDPSKHAGSIVMSAGHEATLAIYVEGPVNIDGWQLAALPNGVLAIRFDDEGNVAAAGLVDLGSAAGTLAPWPEVARLNGDGVLVGGAGFLAQLDAGLATTWHHRYAGDVTFADLAFGSDGSLFAAGSYAESFEPGGGATPSAGHHAGFVAQLDGEEVLWSEKLGDVETRATSVVATDNGKLLLGGSQVGGGDLIQRLDITGVTGFVARRYDDGLLSGTFLGWGARVPYMTMDDSGDVVTRAVGMDEWSQQTVVFKSPITTLEHGWSYWNRMFEWPSVTFTLPSGQTIVANAKSVQRLAR